MALNSPSFRCFDYLETRGCSMFAKWKTNHINISNNSKVICLAAVRQLTTHRQSVLTLWDLYGIEVDIRVGRLPGSWIPPFFFLWCFHFLVCVSCVLLVKCAVCVTHLYSCVFTSWSWYELIVSLNWSFKTKYSTGNLFSNLNSWESIW